jgi:hypothetical protein
MNKTMTLSEINRSYAGQHVIIAMPRRDRFGPITKGQVVAHGVDPTMVWKTADLTGFDRVASHFANTSSIATEHCLTPLEFGPSCTSPDSTRQTVTSSSLRS